MSGITRINEATEHSEETSMEGVNNKPNSVSMCRTDNDTHTATQLCDELKSSVAGKFAHDNHSQVGIFNQITSNLKGSYGNRLYIRSGKYSGGVCLRFCPFCGEKLMSDEEAVMVQHQVEIELTRNKTTEE